VRRRTCPPGAVDNEITTLVEDASNAIRFVVGEDKYSYRFLNGTDLRNPVEALIVPMAVLAHGSGWAFATLIRHGYERESLIFQRQIMEYYVRTKYYVEQPLAALFEWLFDATAEERRFLTDNAATYGSRKRSQEVDSIMASLWRGLGGSQTENITEQKFTKLVNDVRKANGIPRVSVQQMVQRYGFSQDYGTHYGLPSKISHGSQFTRGFAEHHGRLRYYGGIENANVKAALAAEYLIELIDVLKSGLIPAVDVDAAQFRKRLRAIHRAYRIHRPKRTEQTTKRRRAKTAP
jgi:hypothetical protein